MDWSPWLLQLASDGLAVLGLDGLFLAVAEDDYYWAIRSGAEWRWGPILGGWFADVVETIDRSIYDPTPQWA